MTVPRLAIVTSVLACAAGGALAQAYPSKVVRLVVASAPGGGLGKGDAHLFQ